MSALSNLTFEQEALLMQLLHQKFPAQFPPQQQAGTEGPEAEQHDIYEGQEPQPEGEYLPDGDGDSQLYRSDQEGEEDEDND